MAQDPPQRLEVRPASNRERYSGRGGEWVPILRCAFSTGGLHPQDEGVRHGPTSILLQQPAARNSISRKIFQKKSFTSILAKKVSMLIDPHPSLFFLQPRTGTLSHPPRRSLCNLDLLSLSCETIPLVTTITI